MDNIEYLINNATQIDHVVYDMSPATRDGVSTGFPLSERMVILKDVNDWIRTKTALPIQVPEWYAGKSKPTDLEEPRIRSRMSIGAYWHVIGGTAYSHTWKPEPEFTGQTQERTANLWKSTHDNDGTARPWAAMSQIWKEQFPPGTDFYVGVSGDPNSDNAYAIANDTNVVIINDVDASRDIAVNSTVTTLLAYETKVVPLTTGGIASVGPLSAGTIVSDSAVGDVAWTNPGNAAASDDAKATVILTPGQTSQYLKVTNFGFNLPVGATPVGILFSYEAQGSGNNLRDEFIRLVKGGAVVGNNYANVMLNWFEGADKARTRGGEADLWGTTWTRAEINASDFGVVLSCRNVHATSNRTASVDHITLTVYYSV